MPTFTARRHLQMPVTPARGLSPTVLPTTRGHSPPRSFCGLLPLARPFFPSLFHSFLASALRSEASRLLYRRRSFALPLRRVTLSRACVSSPCRNQIQPSLSLSLARARIPSFHSRCPAQAARRRALSLFHAHFHRYAFLLYLEECTTVSFFLSRTRSPSRRA